MWKIIPNRPGVHNLLKVRPQTNSGTKVEGHNGDLGAVPLWVQGQSPLKLMTFY